MRHVKLFGWYGRATQSLSTIPSQSHATITLMKYLIIVLFLASCGSGKSVFSTWTHTSTNAVLDLSTAEIGANSMTLVFVGGAQCGIDLQISGDESSGTFIITNSTYSGGGSGDPGCSSLNGSGTFSVANETLSLCPSAGSCSTYR